MSVEINTSTPYEVDYFTTDVANAWRTKRLGFIKVDENNEAIKEFLLQVEQDPVVLALASSRALGPSGEKEMHAQLKAMSNSLLGVAICLREGLEAGDEGEDTPDEAKKTEKTEKKPTLVGTICLGWGGINAQTAHHRTAHIGIALSRHYQDKGYGREAINWMIDWAFMHAGLHTVCVSAASYNARGIHLYQSLGFRLEGRRQETVYFNRGWYDELDFGMTEWEWEKLRGLSPQQSLSGPRRV